MGLFNKGNGEDLETEKIEHGILEDKDCGENFFLRYANKMNNIRIKVEKQRRDGIPIIRYILNADFDTVKKCTQLMNYDIEIYPKDAEGETDFANRVQRRDNDYQDILRAANEDLAQEKQIPDGFEKDFTFKKEVKDKKNSKKKYQQTPYHIRVTYNIKNAEAKGITAYYEESVNEGSIVLTTIFPRIAE